MSTYSVRTEPVQDVPVRTTESHLLIVLSYSQRIGADGIVDEWTKVVDVCSDPLAGH